MLRGYMDRRRGEPDGTILREADTLEIPQTTADGIATSTEGVKLATDLGPGGEYPPRCPKRPR